VPKNDLNTQDGGQVHKLIAADCQLTLKMMDGGLKVGKDMI